MCQKVMPETAENARGFFLKGNEPSPIEMSIIVARCACGDRYYAKVPSGIIWVEAEPDEKRDLSREKEAEFITQIGEVLA